MTDSQPTSVQKLTQDIEAWLLAHGYDLVQLEVIVSRQRILRLFIDHVVNQNLKADETRKAVTVEDCIAVNKILDEPLETSKEIETIFKGMYELEVSSPGVDRPLRRPTDFERFRGSDVRIHLLRPLTAEESANADYQIKNPKQKNYLGKLQGLTPAQAAVQLEVELGKNRVPIQIPIHLISKCNIEPQFDFETSKKGALNP